MEQSNTVAQPNARKAMLATNMRFDRVLFKKAKIAAATHGTSVQALVNEGLAIRLDMFKRPQVTR